MHANAACSWTDRTQDGGEGPYLIGSSLSCSKETVVALTAYSLTEINFDLCFCLYSLRGLSVC